VPEIKLARLPDRTPIKLSISVTPELHQALSDYAAFHAAAYGQEEPVAELVPAMLAAFLEGDRAFQASRRARGSNGRQSSG
jgi:hypothetical protein